jgi:LCP family protein required for cell wall assembly
MIDSSHRVARRVRLRRERRSQSSCLPLALALGLLLGCLCLVPLVGALGLVRLADQGSALPELGGLPLETQPITILLLGVDRRSDETGPARSDSMMLAGYGQDTGRAVLLSIPRDLWVTIPGVGEQRINAAMVFGDDPKQPAAAPQLAVATVAQAFRRPVDRYAVLDFQTFVRFVDALGGIEIDVPAAIVDTEYPTPDYGMTTIRFDPGQQTMDGERALIYARTRHDDDDFGRSERQQQVIEAAAAKLLDPATWPRLPRAAQVLRAGVQTDLTAADALSLLQMGLAMGQGRFDKATLEGDATTPWVTPGGAWVLLPNWAVIDEVVGRLFGF